MTAITYKIHFPIAFLMYYKILQAPLDGATTNGCQV